MNERPAHTTQWMQIMRKAAEGMEMLQIAIHEEEELDEAPVIGRNRITKPAAMKEESIVMSMDSLKNCQTKAFLPAPIVFFTPISFIFREACAVDRFMKLIQAISKIKKAIRENSLT